MLDLGNDSTRIKKVIVKSYSLKELAAIYKTSRYLLREQLKDYKEQIGKRRGNFYDVNQVNLIFTLIALPSNIRLIKV